jgi:signal transduction histidine kinase
MGVRRWLLERHTGPGDLEWPRWVPATVLACWLVTLTVALVQRDALLPPRPVALLALLALAPGLVELLWCTMPRPLFVGVALAATAGLLVAPAETDFAPFLFVLLAVEVAATSRLALAVSTVLAACAVALALGLRGQDEGWWLWMPGIAAGGVAGYAVQAQMRLLLQERATRAALAERLAAEDRQRVAREVHDVVAHSLGVTMLHLTAARHALESEPEPADIDEAVDSLRAAERVGRQAMGDIRRTIGLLDGPGAGPGEAPAPGAGDLPRLVEEFRAAGIDVRYELRGELGGLSPAAGLDLYRVAAESLANVAKHAPGGCADLVVEAGGDGVRLVVRSSATGDGPARAPDPAPAGGRGLRGMRERVELQGGTLRTGPEGGGWCVEATLPRTLPAAP